MHQRVITIPLATRRSRERGRRKVGLWRLRFHLRHTGARYPKRIPLLFFAITVDIVGFNLSAAHYDDNATAPAKRTFTRSTKSKTQSNQLFVYFCLILITPARTIWWCAFNSGIPLVNKTRFAFVPGGAPQTFFCFVSGASIKMLLASDYVHALVLLSKTIKWTHASLTRCLSFCLRWWLSSHECFEFKCARVDKCGGWATRSISPQALWDPDKAIMEWNLSTLTLEGVESTLTSLTRISIHLNDCKCKLRSNTINVHIS